MENAFSNITARLLDSMSRPFPAPGGLPLDDEFNARALELFALQFQHNPVYRRICSSRKVSPETISSWKAVPFIPTEAFKELELTSIPSGARTHVFHSSGTTGQKPSRHFHSVESLRIYEAALLSGFRQHFSASDSVRFLFLTPPREAAPHSSLVYMFGTISRAIPAAGCLFAGRTESDGSWSIDFDLAIRFLTGAIEHNEPVGILGTAFNFVHLLDELSRRGQILRLPPGSWIMETGGYKGRSRSMPRGQLHGWMSQMLGVIESNIFCEYGMSELSSQAYDRTVGSKETNVVHEGVERLFRFPPWVRVQLICPETGREVREGETGLIRVLDLANVYSVAAVQTEDLAIRRGDGFELLGRAQDAEARGCSLQSQ
jgi:hypothetical protein